MVKNGITVRSGVIKRFNVSWKGGQLDRSMLELDKKSVKKYMMKKYPKRKIKSITQY